MRVSGSLAPAERLDRADLDFAEALGVPAPQLAPEAAQVVGEVVLERAAQDTVQILQCLSALNLDPPPEPRPVFQRGLEAVDLRELRVG